MGHFKKSLFTFIFFAIAITLTQAQSEKISIQGTLKNANGTSVDDGSYSVTFKLYDDPTAGNVVWTEVATVEVAGGIYSHNLGSVTALSPSTFATTLYLGVKVGAYELTPRTELTYAPYALSVGFAQKVVCSGAVGDVKYSILNPTQFAAENGSCWVPMDGRALATTDKLRTITGLTALPNASGVFFRSQEFSGGPDNDPNRTSTSTIAQVQQDDYASHTHAHTLSTASAGAHTHTWTAGIEGDDSGSGGSYNEFTQAPGSQTTSSAGSHTHTINGSISNSGGTETRPINMNLWTYIRIN
jgi:hypothetical protein